MPSATTPAFSWTVTLDEVEFDAMLEVDYYYEPHQPATYEQPAEGGSVFIETIRLLESLDPDHPVEPAVLMLDGKGHADLAEHIAETYLPE